MIGTTTTPAANAGFAWLARPLSPLVVREETSTPAIVARTGSGV
jgi:hypothetical protein